MNNNIAYLTEHRVPTISEADTKCLQAYHNFFKDKQKELQEWLIKELINRPDFGDFIRSQSKEALESQNRHSQQLQYKAIFKNEWEDYVLYQSQQGITFAQMDVNFYSWYDVIRLARTWMIPRLIKETKNEEDVLYVLGGMNLFFDISMSI